MMSCHWNAHEWISRRCKGSSLHYIRLYPPIIPAAETEELLQQSKNLVTDSLSLKVSPLALKKWVNLRLPLHCCLRENFAYFRYLANTQPIERRPKSQSP